MEPGECGGAGCSARHPQSHERRPPGRGRQDPRRGGRGNREHGDPDQQLRRIQTPPMRPDEFEDEVRRSIVNEKLQAALTGWMTVAESDVVSEFKKRNEKAKFQVANCPADKFREGVVATDAEVAKY